MRFLSAISLTGSAESVGLSGTMFLQLAKPVVTAKNSMGSDLANLDFIWEFSRVWQVLVNTYLCGFYSTSIPQMGDHNSKPKRDNQLNDVRCMPPKYDLILQKNGKIKIKQIMAIDINDAIAKGKLERSDLKGVVFSDQNKESSM